MYSKGDLRSVIFKQYYLRCLAHASYLPGDSQLHFVFHPNGRLLDSLQEEGSTLVTFAYDGATGRLTAKQTISSLPPAFARTNLTSEVAISPSARLVYAANRLHDTIAWLAVAAGGTLRFAGEEPTRSDDPRFFTFDPSGSFVYSCNQRADAIASFRTSRMTALNLGSSPVLRRIARG